MCVCVSVYVCTVFRKKNMFLFMHRCLFVLRIFLLRCVITPPMLKNALVVKKMFGLVLQTSFQLIKHLSICMLGHEYAMHMGFYLSTDAYLL